MKCTAYSKRRADGELLRLEPRRSLYGRRKNAGFSVVGHRLHQKLHIEGRICGLSPRMRLHPGKGRPRLPQNPLPDVLGWKYSGNRHHPTEKPVTSLQPLIESFTRTQLCWTRLQAAARPASPPSSPDAGISVSSCLSSITVPGSNALPPCNGPCSRGPRMMTGLCRRLRK